MWTIFNVFIEFVTVLLLFCVLVFGHKACGTFTALLGIIPALPPTLESKVLTIGLPGKSLKLYTYLKNLFIFNWIIIALQCCADFCHTST